MSAAYLLDRDTVTEGILALLERFVRTADRVLDPRPHQAGEEPGLIRREAGGVRANLRAFWWAEQYPSLVVALLALLDVPLLNRDEVVAWVKAQQHVGGYFRANRTGRAVRQATYRACAMLRLLGAADDLDGWERARLVALLRSQQQSGQRRHFAFLPGDLKSFYAEPDLAYYCVATLALLDERLPDPDAAIRWLQARQEPSGTFKIGLLKQQPYSRLEATYRSVATLRLLGAAPRDAAACVAALQDLQIADGGFNEYVPAMRTALVDRLAQMDGAYDDVSSGWARYLAAPVSGLRDTAHAVLTLRLLGASPRDVEACRRRIVALWDPLHGWFVPHATWPVCFDAPWYIYAGLLAAITLGLLPAPRTAMPLYRHLWSG